MRSPISLVILVLLLPVARGVADWDGEDKQDIKIICASRADQAPVIDGVLDDACWQQTEERGDFTTIGERKQVSQKTTMRWVYDDENLYLGLHFSWDDTADLNKGVADIIAAHGADQKQPCQWDDFVNYYSAELFIDRGATRKNYYQVLFNGAGQLCGHFNTNWDLYKGEGQHFKSSFEGGGWTAEFVYPAKGLKPGDRWGLNLVRNSGTGAYAIWNQTGGPFNKPDKFATMMIGSYREWWQAVWAEGAMKRLGDLAKDIPKYTNESPALAAIYNKVREEADKLSRVADTNQLASRDDFETMYNAYNSFQKRFSRLLSLVETHELIAGVS